MEKMRLKLSLILLFLWQFAETDATIFLPSSSNPDENFSNRTHFTWILYAPWKHHPNLFNVNTFNHSADYFSINQDDHITNQSYIETTRIPACKSIHLTFSSKVHYLGKEISLILLTYQGNTWKKSWEYMYNDSQWGLHQLSLNISETKEDIRLRYLPSSHSADQISLDMTVPMISTNPNCTFNQTSTPFNSSSSGRRAPSIQFFLFITFGSLFLLLFTSVMMVFIYSLISKQYNRWLRKRSSGHRRNRRKTTNVVGDESTVLGLETDTV